MSKLIGVDTSNIDNVSGFFTTQSGGIAAVPVTLDRGVVICPFNLGPYGPFSKGELDDYQNHANMFQIDSMTGVKQMVNYDYQFAVLKTNGDLYIGGHSNTGSYGIGFPEANALINDGGIGLSLTGVDVVSPMQGGFFAIKTNGTLWWAGSCGTYLNNTGTGQGTTTSSYTWTQIGSDTDWVDIKAFARYPYTAIAIKGGTGAKYLYSCGYNNNYGTGLGTNSGQTYSWTRVKSDATTNLSDSISKIAISYGSCLAVTEDGKLLSWGENSRGILGAGNTTDKPYATQVGTATDWRKCYVCRYGGFAINSSNELYMSTNVSTWRIEPNTTGTFGKVNNDTDYDDIAVFDQTSNSMDYTVWAKKNGVWHVSTAYSQPAGGWVGSTQQSSTPVNGWSSLTTYMENYPTGTIDFLMPFAGTSSQGEPAIMLAIS